jgi:hypothetical protein
MDVWESEQRFEIALFEGICDFRGFILAESLHDKG